MPRSDLLALTLEDLAALTNRGTVKRAAREIDSAEVTFTLAEDDRGEVRVTWSDDVTCTFPAEKTVSQGRCSCVATTLCRHLMRSVLAYQKQAAGGEVKPPTPQPWDPGAITDDQLATHFKKPVLASLQKQFDQGVLVELVRSAKPTARFHQLACTLRFLVPNDLRYTHCDCAEPAPCSHVPLAVWAFRQLPTDQVAGILSTQTTDLSVPTELLDAAESLLAELIENGMAGAPSTWKDRLVRAASACQSAELVWPAEVLAELVQQYERYVAHDARFAPDRVSELIGEWLIRAHAIRSSTRATPQVLIRGTSSDHATEIGSARYIGLGCGAEQDRAGVTITAYLQDSDSGSVVAISRDFPDPAKDSKDLPHEYCRLAQTPVVRGITLASLGAGQLLLQGGKRSADHRLSVGRAKASATLQNYNWEALRAPVLAEDFGELRARLAALPPASLRPRYVAEDLHVIRVASLRAWHFNEASQSVELQIADGREESAHVQHPYHARAREGTEALLNALSDATSILRFVAGQVRQGSAGLIIYPICLVFERGGHRYAIQPWVDRVAPNGKALPSNVKNTDQYLGRANAIDDFPRQLLNQAGELVLLGLRRSDASAARSWAESARHGESIGYDRLVRPVASLAEELNRKLSVSSWAARDAVRFAMEIILLAKLAQDAA